MKQDSFIDFLDAYGRANPPELPYNEDRDFDSWKTALKEKLLQLRGPLPDRVNPEVTIVETINEPDHTRYLLQIAVSAFSTLPAYLLVPNDLEKGEKRPGVLVSHGHCAHGINTICGVADNAKELDRYALHAVQSGYVTIVPAWWGWEGRTGHLDRIGSRDKCNVIQMAASMYGFNTLSLHIQDAQAAIDVLMARDEVDSNRIGCLGNSTGGRTAMWFTIFDERITACISAGSMNTFRERSLILSSCGIQYLPGLLRYADVPDLFCLIAPCPLQLQAGEGDRLITPAHRDMIVKKVRGVYQRLGIEDRFSYELHPHGHALFWEPAKSFLKQHL
jgi:dienelactone hydrolase